MRTVKPKPKRGACYPSGQKTEILGYALIVVGVILLFCCIPGWAWCALLGVALVVVGYIVLKLSKSWR